MRAALSLASAQHASAYNVAHGACDSSLATARQQAEAAVNYLQHLPHGAAQDRGLYAPIDNSCRDLVAYMAVLHRESRPLQDVDDRLVCALTDPVFLTAIFEQRAAFRSRCRTGPTAQNTVLVFWTDDLLVALSGLSTMMIRDVTNEDSLPATLREVSKATQIRAATQLPESWLDLATILQSKDASPAVKRLATSLLYAAYCLRPGLSHGSERPHDLAVLYPCLRQHLHQLDLFAEYDDTGRLSLAMLLALYAQTDFCCADPRLIMPLTSSVLNDMMHILFPGDHTDPAPDSAQTLIVEWSCTVPWAWSFFRLDVHNDAVLKFTRAWVASWLHSHRSNTSPPCLPTLELAHSALIAAGLGSSLNRSAASHAVAALASQSPTANNPELRFLFSLLVLLIRDGGDAFSIEACRRMASQLLDDGPSGELVPLALEYLSLADPTQVKLALDPVLMLWKQVSSAVATLLENEGTSLEFRLKTLLDFGTLLARADPDACKSARPSLGTPVQRWLTKHPTIPLLQSALQLWASLAPSAVKLPSTLWDMIYSRGPTDLCLASSFAQYLAAKGAISADDAEEAFDYLRDAFLLGATIQPAQARDELTLGEQTGIGLFVAPMLCLALGVLAAAMSPEAARFSLESPMTETFVAELQRVVGETHSALNPVDSVLSQTLGANGVAAASLREMKRLARVNEGAFSLPGLDDGHWTQPDAAGRAIVFLRSNNAAPDWTVLVGL